MQNELLFVGMRSSKTKPKTNMEPVRKQFIYAFSILFLMSCDKDEQTASLIVDCVNQMDLPKSVMLSLEPAVDNPWITDNMKFTILDIAVSQGLVEEGNPDDLTWYNVGVNNQLKFWNEYTFFAEKLPVGTYRSLRVNFRNVWYRYAYLQSDPSVRFEGMENMLGWFRSCSEEAPVPTNYFSSGGNHQLGDQGFFVVNEHEKIDLFSLEEGVLTRLYWILGQEGSDTLDPCTFTWYDENNNGVWDCDQDRLDFYCPPGWHSMFDFRVEYEEPE